MNNQQAIKNIKDAIGMAKESRGIILEREKLPPVVKERMELDEQHIDLMFDLLCDFDKRARAELSAWQGESK